MQRPRQVRAEVAKGGLKTLGRFSLLVADETALPSFMGSITLRCQPGAVDLGRVRSGLVGFCIDHDPSAMLGTVTGARIDGGAVYAEAEVYDLARSRAYLPEIRAGLRSGISPGFIIHEVSPSKCQGAKEFDVVVTKWEPYEISSTPVPRNAEAKIVGEFGMNSTNYAAPSLQSTSDITSLSVECARQLVASGKGSPGQLAKLGAFLSVYDSLIASGQSRDTAAQAAAAAALPA